ncbi:hypothetical protein [Actinoplanes sp. NPDC049265]|uniref:hypothetical protein n=1 Tax=Actinoplanes sp. NPDC049265 TaxID=3363902 RepID=UPI00371D6968
MAAFDRPDSSGERKSPETSDERAEPGGVTDETSADSVSRQTQARSQEGDSSFRLSIYSADSRGPQTPPEDPGDQSSRPDESGQEVSPEGKERALTTMYQNADAKNDSTSFGNTLSGGAQGAHDGFNSHTGVPSTLPEAHGASADGVDLGKTASVAADLAGTYQDRKSAGTMSMLGRLSGSGYNAETAHNNVDAAMNHQGPTVLERRGPSPGVPADSSDPIGEMGDPVQTIDLRRGGADGSGSDGGGDSGGGADGGDSGGGADGAGSGGSASSAPDGG